MNWEAELTNKLSDLSNTLENRQVELSSCEGTVPDDSDAATLLESRAVIQSDIQRLHKEKEKLDKALEKIKDGTFGYCDECGIEIPPKRLEANLSTVFCVDCQSALEHQQKHYLRNIA